MKHKEASESYAAERYFLNEMSKAERDSFEEHFFECAECARDVQAMEMFQANAKAVFEDRFRVARVPSSGWQRFSRQSAAAAAGLLLVGSLTAYQNLVTIPRLSQVVENTRSVQPIEYIAAKPVVRGGPEQGESRTSTLGPEYHDIALRIPPQQPGYERYRVVFQPECGPIAQAEPPVMPAPDAGLPSFLRVPAAELSSGICRLTLMGLSSGAGEKELGEFSFSINKPEE